MMLREVKSEAEMKAFGETIGALLCGGDFIELSGDVGTGKTTLARGIAIGLGVDENVQSPSFTIKRVYEARDHLTLAHYDFYRLDDAGIMTNELQESVTDPETITIVEWSGVVDGVLPLDRLSIKITSPSERLRELALSSGGENSKKLEEQLTV
jgi:tRNA threonylcarbamoyladenosine biosynthesis protein TsaE